jgi:hypothetical protein
VFKVSLRLAVWLKVKFGLWRLGLKSADCTARHRPRVQRVALPFVEKLLVIIDILFCRSRRKTRTVRVVVLSVISYEEERNLKKLLVACMRHPR